MSRHSNGLVHSAVGGSFAAMMAATATAATGGVAAAVAGAAIGRASRSRCGKRHQPLGEQRGTKGA